jgi:hypothetical protein
MCHYAYWMITRRHGVYLISFYKVGRNQIRYKKKMAREYKHWEIGNFDMTLFHKDGKLWLFYV